jgi:tetratricopeptide (TPR) repeat protein
MIAHPLSCVQGWRWSLVLAAALTGTPWGLPPPARADDAPAKSEKAQEELKAARAARRAGDWAEAERRLKECERLHGPAEADALERKLLAAQRGDMAGVEKDLIDAVKKDHPDSVLILEALAQGYRESCRPRDESRALDEWLRRKPDNPEVLYRLGRAVERLPRASNETWNIGPSPQAMKYYRRAVEADPKHDAARLRLAEGLLEQQNAPEALEHFQRLRERRPKDPAVVLGLARCAILMGRTEEGTNLLDRYLADHPQDVRALTERGKVALQEGQVAKAEGLLRRAVQRAPSDYHATYVLFSCLGLAGKEAEAKEYRTRLENIKADLKRLPDCIESAERHPQDPVPRCEAGLILLRLGEEKEGLRWLRSALRVDPKHRATHGALADYYRAKGDKELAEKHGKLAQDGRKNSD